MTSTSTSATIDIPNNPNIRDICDMHDLGFPDIAIKKHYRHRYVVNHGPKSSDLWFISFGSATVSDETHRKIKPNANFNWSSGSVGQDTAIEVSPYDSPRMPSKYHFVDDITQFDISSLAVDLSHFTWIPIQAHPRIHRLIQIRRTLGMLMNRPPSQCQRNGLDIHSFIQLSCLPERQVTPYNQ